MSTSSASDETPPLYGLDAWADYLEQRPLPVRVSVLVRLKRLVNSDNATLHQITDLVRQDPALCFHVTRLAQSRHRQKNSTVTSIEHAVGSLGMDALAALCQSLQTLKVNPASMQQKMYFRAIADSQHASVQAAELCRMRGLPFVEEVRLAALLYGAVHWMLWLHAPLHKHQYQKRVLQDGVDVALAEQDLLGCTAQALGAELAKRWDLPELTQQALDHDTSPSQSDLRLLHRRALKDPRMGKLELREANQLAQQRFFPVKLGNWLALTTTRGWYSKKAAHLMDILADYLSTQPDVLLGQLHGYCAEASRQFHVPGTLSPASEMLLIPSGNQYLGMLSDQEIKRLIPEAPRPVKPKPAPPPLKVAEDKPARPVTECLHPHIYKQVFERLQKGYELYTTPAHILQALLQGLHQGLGLSRVSLMLVNPKTLMLHTRRSLGIDDKHPLASLELSLDVPSLFKRLSEKPAGIWIDTPKRHSLAPMLPEAFSAAVAEHDYLLMSVFRNDQPLAILYADDIPGHTALTDFQYEQFRQLCAAATLALKRLPG